MTFLDIALVKPILCDLKRLNKKSNHIIMFVHGSNTFYERTKSDKLIMALLMTTICSLCIYLIAADHIDASFDSGKIKSYGLAAPVQIRLTKMSVTSINASEVAIPTSGGHPFIGESNAKKILRPLTKRKHRYSA
jgi:hypothetical protein